MADGIFAVRQRRMEKRKTGLYYGVYLEKAHDRVPRSSRSPEAQ